MLSWFLCVFWDLDVQLQDSYWLSSDNSSSQTANSSLLKHNASPFPPQVGHRAEALLQFGSGRGRGLQRLESQVGEPQRARGAEHLQGWETVPPRSTVETRASGGETTGERGVATTRRKHKVTRKFIKDHGDGTRTKRRSIPGL